jgi:hypothetical protein
VNILTVESQGCAAGILNAGVTEPAAQVFLPFDKNYITPPHLNGFEIIR